MPMLKTISGHTPTRGIFRYLTKKNRALACDFLNIDVPDATQPETAFDWAAVMDRTRHAFGNDLPWRGKRVRTYKHYVVSPDPKDHIDLATLRKLATVWASKHFADHEVAIIYHDDNQNGIPHAHVIVNNTNLETGRRLQDSDPKALAASLQKMAAQHGLSTLDPAKPRGVSARAERHNPRAQPATYRDEYVRRAEKELTERGAYSWTADIRARVRIARSAARSETEFRNLLGTLDVTLSDNSPKAARRDWIYTLANHPTRRVSGERLGLAYGRERLEPLLRIGGAGNLADSGERVVAAIARRAIEIGNLEELNLLSKTVALIETTHATSLADLDALPSSEPSIGIEDTATLVNYAHATSLLPAQRPPVQVKYPSSLKKNRQSASIHTPHSALVEERLQVPQRHEDRSEETR